LKLNRYLLAGNVHLDSGNVHEIGAAFAGYPDIDRSYFLSAHGDPDKWTFFGLDFNDQHRGRSQPGDAYFIPDVSSDKPYITASTAMILPKTNVKFGGSRIYVLGVYIPTGAWVEQFSANPNYEQNAFAGANFDIGLPYQGSEHAVSALHLRYDGFHKFYLSFDQHFVWGRDYVVFSINPLTQTEKQYNLVAYKRISPKMEIRLFAQESAQQHGIYEPLIASAYSNLSYVVSLHRSSIALTGDQYNNSLINYPPHSLHDTQVGYDHPSDFQLAWTGRDTPLYKNLPINFRLRSGYGLAYDSYHCGNPPRENGCGQTPDIGIVLDYFGPDRTRVPTITQHFTGLTLFSNSIPLDTLHTLNFNLNFDKQVQWFSLPHHYETTATTASISKVLQRKYAFYGAFEVQEQADYWGGRQLEFYPPDDPTNNGVSYPGYEAFRGLATSRVATIGAIVTPTQYFNYTFTLHHTNAFPQSAAGFFGPAPWQMINEIRIRLAKQVLMDITRTEYFNYGGYTPQYNVGFGP
jgi:hypothetical protein